MLKKYKNHFLYISLMIKFMTIHLKLFPKRKLILYDVGLQHVNIIHY